MEKSKKERAVLLQKMRYTISGVLVWSKFKQRLWTQHVLCRIITILCCLVARRNHARIRASVEMVRKVGDACVVLALLQVLVVWSRARGKHDFFDAPKKTSTVSSTSCGQSWAFKSLATRLPREPFGCRRQM
jgi:hypothetical protein